MNHWVLLSYLLWTMRTQITVFESLRSSLFCLPLAWVAWVVECFTLQEHRKITLSHFVFQRLKLIPALERLLALSLEPELESEASRAEHLRCSSPLPLDCEKRDALKLS